MTRHSSTVGSIQGNVTIQAPQHYRQLASQVVAPQGHVEMTAGEIAILDGHNQLELTQESSSYSSGLTVGVTNPALSAAQTALQLESAVSQTDDPRLLALATAAGGLAAKNSYDAIKTNPKRLGGVNVSFSVGQSESHSESRQSHSTAQRSQVVGRHIIIQARKGDATLQGDVQAAEQARITATGQIKLLASENRSQQQSEQSSSSSSIGVGIGTHSGPAVTVSLSLAEGSRHGESGSYTLAQVSAGQKVVLQSGGDTLIQGEIRAPQVQGKVGGNLMIASLQETDHQEGQQESLSGSLSVGYGHVSGSFNVNQSGYRSDFASVQQQAGIKAGDGGFQLQVAGNTHLEGGVIASSEKAIAAGCNQLETSTLTQQAIENHADYKAHSIGIGGGFSKESGQPKQPALQQNGVGKNQPGQAAPGALQVPGSQLPSQHGLSATMPIVMVARGSASSSTPSGISGAGQAVRITHQAAQQALTGQTPEQAIAALDATVTSDKDGSNALSPIFDRQKIEAGFQIVGTLAREVGTFLENRAKEQTQGQKALKEEQAKAPEQQDQQKIGQLQQTLQETQTWEMGGKGRLLLSALTLAAGSNVTGSTSQLLQATTVNIIQSYGAQQIKLLADSMNSEAARTGLQGLLAGTGAAAQGQNATPAALGASASVVLNNLMNSAYGEASHQFTADERQARKNLVTTLIAGTTQALGGDAALANAAATIEMENNSMGMLPGSTLGLWLAPSPDGDRLSTAKLAGTLAEKNLELASYVGGLPLIIAQDATQDISALHKGETTLEEIARQRGVQYVTGALVGKLAQKGIGIAVQGGRLALAPIVNNIQRSVAIQQSQKVVYSTLKKLGINLRPITTPAGQVVIIKPQVAKLADTGMQWGQGIAKQGHAWENYCAKQAVPGSRLTPNFKTFDFFDEATKTAISAKSLDTLTPAKLAKPSQIYSTMKNKMIDPIIDFKKHTLGKSIVTAEEILRREIHLGIPKGTQPAQWEQINRGVQYAQDNGIQIIITVIKP